MFKSGIDRFRLWYRARRFLRRSEPNETRFTCDVIAPGDCALDIGANKGAYSYWMKRRVGPSGRVYSFEPQPNLAEYLNRIAKSSRRRNLVVCPVALSDSQGTGRMVVPAHCWGTLEFPDNPDGHPEISVPLVRLDDYMTEIAGARPVSFIKCDVEGHELAVFRGATKILSEDRPVLLFETAPLMLIDAKTHPVFMLLNDLGFVGYFFWKSELIPIAQYSPTEHQLTNRIIQNYVFLHNQTHQLVSSTHPYRVESMDVQESQSDWPEMRKTLGG